MNKYPFHLQNGDKHNHVETVQIKWWQWSLSMYSPWTWQTANIMSILRIAGTIILDKILTSSINAPQPKETVLELAVTYAMSNMTGSVIYTLTVGGRWQKRKHNSKGDVQLSHMKKNPHTKFGHDKTLCKSAKWRECSNTEQKEQKQEYRVFLSR